MASSISVLGVKKHGTNRVPHNDDEQIAQLAILYGAYFICKINSDVYSSHPTAVYPENCIPLLNYLRVKQAEWKKQHRVADVLDKNEWWGYCKPIIYKILRGVCRGLTILHDNSLLYEDWTIFVTPEGDGKLYLFGQKIKMDKAALGVKLEELHLIVSEVVGYPFNLKDVETDPGFGFSNEDIFLFDILHRNNLNFASYKWILDNPVIWTEDERSDFIMKLDSLIDKQHIRLKSFATELASMYGYKYENAFPMSRHLDHPNLIWQEGKEEELGKVFPDYYADMCRGLLSLSIHCKSLKQEWASWDMIQAELHSTNRISTTSKFSSLGI